MSNATGNLLITGQVIEDENFKALVGLQDVLVAGIGLKNLMQQANKIDFAGAVSKLKNQSLELGESFWKQAREHLTIWENLKASPDIFRQIPEKVKTQIENLSEILKKEHRRLRNYELKPIKGALFSGIGLELKKILSDEAYKKLQSLKLGDELEKALYQDLKGNQSLRKAFNEKPNSLEAWFVLSSDKSLRKNVADISNMQKYLDEPYEELIQAGGDFSPDLAKVKRAFEAAKKNGKVSNFINKKFEFVSGSVVQGKRTYKSVPPDFELFEKLKNYLQKNNTITFEARGKKYELRNVKYESLELGYAGVMTPDGRATFVMTSRLKGVDNNMELYNTSDKFLLTESAKRKIIQEGFPDFLKKEFGLDIGTLAFRNASHEFGQTILRNQIDDDLLWGFALNPRGGDNSIIEIGFVSGRVNLDRGNGLKNPHLENPSNQRRASGILNRTDQKQLIDFVINSTYLKSSKIILKDGINGKGKYW